MILRREFLNSMGKILGGCFIFNAISFILPQTKEAFAATGDVSGYVHDARITNGISGANISIDLDGSVTTDSNGHYNKLLSYGTYIFR